MPRWRVLLRPLCWLLSHEGRVMLSAGWVAEEAEKPPGSYCARCLKAPVDVPLSEFVR